MAGKKYYAVRVGRSVGIYTSWDDCQKQINGYPGAIFKSFLSLEEAKAYLLGENPSVAADEVTEDGPVAYVDGSFDSESGAYGAGAVILYQGETVELSQRFDDTEAAQMHNVAGEIQAARMVMEYAVKQNWQTITIYHDYQGIAAWCDGSWQAKTAGTQAYRRFYLETAKKMHIQFVKVKGHSGNRYNDWADRLARESLGK